MKITEDTLTMTKIILSNAAKPLNILWDGWLLYRKHIPVAICVQNHTEHIGLAASNANTSFLCPIINLHYCLHRGAGCEGLPYPHESKCRGMYKSDENQNK